MRPDLKRELKVDGNPGQEDFDLSVTFRQKDLRGRPQDVLNLWVIFYHIWDAFLLKKGDKLNNKRQM